MKLFESTMSLVLSNTFQFRKSSFFKSIRIIRVIWWNCAYERKTNTNGSTPFNHICGCAFQAAYVSANILAQQQKQIQN